jgi:hypothetical protein
LVVVFFVRVYLFDAWNGMGLRVIVNCSHIIIGASGKYYV